MASCTKLLLEMESSVQKKASALQNVHKKYNGLFRLVCSYPLVAITDLEKVVNRPQAENSEFFNVLKIA